MANEFAAPEPRSRVSSSEHIDLLLCEVNALDAEIQKRSDRIDGKPNAKGLVFQQTIINAADDFDVTWLAAPSTANRQRNSWAILRTGKISCYRRVGRAQ